MLPGGRPLGHRLTMSDRPEWPFLDCSRVIKEAVWLAACRRATLNSTVVNQSTVYPFATGLSESRVALMISGGCLAVFENVFD